MNFLVSPVSAVIACRSSSYATSFQAPSRTQADVDGALAGGGVATLKPKLTSSMEDYIDPTHSYHTDGILVGEPLQEYFPYFEDLEDFDDAIAAFANSQRKPDRVDIVSFWDRSQSDSVSGDLIYVNNVDNGTRITGAKYQPYGGLSTGVANANNGATIELSPVSRYTGAPASTYGGVTRIEKPLRLQKAPGLGVVRITN